MGVMKAIWKYEIWGMDMFGIDMPKGAEILSVQIQQGLPYIWALVDPEATLVNRTFINNTTGSRVLPENMKFIGTYQRLEGASVFHLFEIIKGAS